MVFDVSGECDLEHDAGSGGVESTLQGSLEGLRLIEGSNDDTLVYLPGEADANELLAQMQGNSALTAQALVNADSDGNARVVTYSSGTPTKERNFSLLANDEGDQLEIDLRLSTTVGLFQEEFDVDWSDAPQVIAMSYDGLRDGVVRLYVDGAQVASW